MSAIRPNPIGTPSGSSIYKNAAKMAPAPTNAPLAILMLSPAPLEELELLALLELAVLLPDEESEPVELGLDDEPVDEDPDDAVPDDDDPEPEVDADAAAEEIPAVAPVVMDTEVSPMTLVVDEPTETRIVVFWPMGTVLMPGRRPAGMVATAGWLVMTVGWVVMAALWAVATAGMPVTTPRELVSVRKEVKPLV